MNAPLAFPEPIRLTPELRKKLEAAVDQILRPCRLSGVGSSLSLRIGRVRWRGRGSCLL